MDNCERAFRKKKSTRGSSKLRSSTQIYIEIQHLKYHLNLNMWGHKPEVQSGSVTRVAELDSWQKPGSHDIWLLIKLFSPKLNHCVNHHLLKWPSFHLIVPLSFTSVCYLPSSQGEGWLQSNKVFWEGDHMHTTFTIAYFYNSSIVLLVVVNLLLWVI